MIFTADQMVAHLVGDYLLQSHWMATEKTKDSFAAGVHAVTYTLPFLFITQSPEALAIILVSHFFIDRFRLARIVVWLKNWPIAGVDFSNGDYQGRFVYKPLTATGYQDDVPAWLSVWLLIIADNTIHLICNGLAIWYFGGFE